MVGKKAKTKEDMKTHLLQVKLSEGDFQRIKDMAAAEGLYVSDLVRLRVLGAKPDEPKQDSEPKEITLPGYPGTFKLPTKGKKRSG